MKKIFAMLVLMVLAIPFLQAEDRHRINSITYDASLTVAYSTPTASACEVAYVLVESTGPVASRTVTVRDGTTDKFVIEIPATSATDRVINISEFPVRFGTSLNYNISAVDGSIRITLIYRKLN